MGTIGEILKIPGSALLVKDRHDADREWNWGEGPVSIVWQQP